MKIFFGGSVLKHNFFLKTTAPPCDAINERSLMLYSITADPENTNFLRFPRTYTNFNVLAPMGLSLFQIKRAGMNRFLTFLRFSNVFTR